MKEYRKREKSRRKKARERKREAVNVDQYSEGWL